MTLTVGSLFSGIGGLDLGLERAGMTVAWQAEIDPYCCRILERHWPDVPNLGDVTSINWENVPRVDLICGGYPCQPFSTAGARRGAGDPRHLWPHMRDAIRTLRPRWALLENVPGHLSLGFGRVLGDLAEIGFDAEWDCIPAAAVGAPHLRWRVFVVAYPQSGNSRPNGEATSGARIGEVPQPTSERGTWGPTRGSSQSGDVPDPERDQLRHQPGRRNGQDRSGEAVARDDGPDRHVADTDGPRLEGRGLRRAATERGGDVADTTLQPGDGLHHHPRSRRESLGTRPDVPVFGNDASPPRPDGDWWTVEPDVGRVAHGIPHRVDRLRALGNAVVPQVAEHIGRLILEAAA